MAKRKADATAARTLAEIEEEEEIPAKSSDSTIPTPDEGPGREQHDDAGGPM